MKLAVMQPYFFPYLGYYSLIKHTDRFIIIDDVQYIKEGWIARNRILTLNGGWTYIIVPLEHHSYKCTINEVRICNNEDWKIKIFRHLEHYRKANFYHSVIEVLHDSLKDNCDSITLLDTQILKITCNYLGVKFNYDIFSQMNLKLGEIKTSSDWPLNISKCLKADAYYNPPGGIKLYDKEIFTNAGVDLKFLKISLNEYNQGNSTFEPGLSIIDVMMFNSPEAIRQMLDQFELL
jgi:hypothetical protein